MVRPEDLGPGWSALEMDPEAYDKKTPHEYCKGPFKTDAYRTDRLQTAMHHAGKETKFEEEANRYQRGKAAAALQEFRDNLTACSFTRQGVPPNDYTATIEPADGAAPRIGTDSVTVRVRYTVGAFVMYSVMTVAIQDDVLIGASTIANTPDEAMALAQTAFRIAAQRAGFRH